MEKNLKIGDIVELQDNGDVGIIAAIPIEQLALKNYEYLLVGDEYNSEEIFILVIGTGINLVNKNDVKINIILRNENFSYQFMSLYQDHIDASVANIK